MTKEHVRGWRKARVPALPFIFIGLLGGCTSNGIQVRDEGEGADPAYVREVSDGVAIAKCSDIDGRQTERVEPSGEDLVVGPLRYPGLANGYASYQGLPATLGSDGLAYYKIGVELEQSSEATVAIGAAAREYASILVENGRSDGYSEITYVSCPDLPSDTVSWWVGGFLLHDRDSACVPIEITVPGKETEVFNIGFPAGACD